MGLNDIEVAERFTKLEHSLEFLEHRIEKNDQLTVTIYNLTTRLELLTEQIKNQSERFSEALVKHDNKFKEQGTRIGIIENKNAHKWDSAVQHIIFLILGAAAMYGVGKLF